MKYSQLFIIILAFIWAFLPTTAEQKIIFLGFITIYLGLHNFIGFKLAEKGKTTMRKLNLFNDKMGPKWGPRIYLVVFVLLPFAFGLFVLISGMMLYISD